MLRFLAWEMLGVVGLFILAFGVFSLNLCAESSIALIAGAIASISVFHRDYVQFMMSHIKKKAD